MGLDADELCGGVGLFELGWTGDVLVNGGLGRECWKRTEVETVYCIWPDYVSTMYAQYDVEWHGCSSLLDWTELVQLCLCFVIQRCRGEDPYVTAAKLYGG